MDALSNVTAPQAAAAAGAASLGYCLYSCCSVVTRPAPSGPLAGVKVLDASVVIAAPFAAAVLGDLGAEVIKVESMAMADSARGLGTSPARGMGGMFIGTARSKQSVMLNLKSAEGKATFMELAKQCDVVLQNFRPGAVESMGIDYDVVKKANPDVIYLSSSGFGPTGPYSEGRIYDPIIQVLSGFADVQRTETGEARLAAQVIFDKACALASAQAITSALFARDRGAGGQHIQMSMLDLALQWLWPDNYWNDVYADSTAPASPPLHETPIFTQAATCPKASIKQALAGHEALFETVRSSFPLFGKFRAPRFPATFSGTPLGSRPGPPMMGEHTVKILKELGKSDASIQEMLSKGDATSTVTLMAAMGKPLPEGPAKAAVAKAGKAFGLWEKVQRGRTLNGSTLSAPIGTSPAWSAGKGAMHGVVVIDLCSLLAGPMAAMMLADQGAECVKVELPGSADAARSMGQQPNGSTTTMGAMFAAANRNKKCVAIDYTTGDGLAALLPLLQKADVIFVDASQDQALSSAQDAFRKAAAGAIFVTIEKRGGEFAVQAASGQTEDQKNAEGQPTFLKTMATEKTTAAYAAMCASSALFAKQRGAAGGKGQHIQIDMQAVAFHNTTTDILMNSMWLAPGGSGAKAFPSIGQCYQTVCCKDGVYAFTLSLSDKECEDFMETFKEAITPEVSRSRRR